MPNWESDDECTAAPGVMGTTACHRYPGCGCGGQPETVSERTAREGYRSGDSVRSPYQDRPSFERPSDWHVRTFHKIETLRKGFFRIWLDRKSWAENSRYFPCKVDGNKLIFHKTVVKSNLKEFFDKTGTTL